MADVDLKKSEKNSFEKHSQLRTGMKCEFLLFLPLLVLYAIIVITSSTNTFEGDEGGYVEFARRLSQGYYSPRNDVKLWWGPGYPIVLLPFVLLSLPWMAAKFLNAFFLYAAILYFYKTLKLYIPKKFALVFTYLFGLYPPFMKEVHLLYTESFIFLLICGYTYHFCSLYKSPIKPWFHLLIASVHLGFLALTKVFFGYVILVSVLLFLFLYAWQQKDILKKTLYVYLIALICCFPYLLYTYSLTNKIFYWGTSGGILLYWMSTPYKNEWGSWFSPENVQELPELVRHREFFNEITGLSEVEMDNAFKRRAIYNITHYPTEYLINWLANIGRLLFSYPFSYSNHKLTTYFYLLPNMFITVFFILSVYPAILRWKSVPYEICALLSFDLISFGGTSLLSAYARQFSPLVPILLLWLSFIYVRVLKIDVRRESEIIFS